jgi:hypothetical protein
MEHYAINLVLSLLAAGFVVFWDFPNTWKPHADHTRSDSPLLFTLAHMFFTFAAVFIGLQWAETAQGKTNGVIVATSAALVLNIIFTLFNPPKKGNVTALIDGTIANLGIIIVVFQIAQERQKVWIKNK